MSAPVGAATQTAVRAGLARAGRTLSSTHVVGEAGQGLVRATLAGDGRIVKLHVAKGIGKEGPRAIETLVVSAVNRAHDRLREETRRQVMSDLPPNVDPSMVLRSLP